MADTQTADTIVVRTCPVEGCRLHVRGESLFGMRRHQQSRHPDADWSADELPLTEISREEYDRRRREERSATTARSKEKTGAAHAAPASPAPTDLKATERALAQNIEAIGAILATVLHTYKGFIATHPGASIKLFGTDRELPYLETTLGHTINARGKATAGVVMGFAAENEALLRWVERFNLAMTGGEVGGLVADHALGALHTAMPTNTQLLRFAGMRLPDVLNKVMAENAELQQQVDELQRQVANAPSNGGPS